MDRTWNAATVAYLQFHERDVAVRKLSHAIRWYFSDRPALSDALASEFWQCAIRRPNYRSIAAGL
jgi:hypothetical protein